jgi:hypothetical protein
MAEATPAVAPRERGHDLDELMLAMDVVDTLRHNENLAARELDETRREAALIERLRQIYHGQGIEVPDRVLQEGVRALKESRFVYTPPPPGLGTTLARLWVSRGRIGRGLLGMLAALGLAWGAYEFGVVRPERQRAEQARIDAEARAVAIRERLPQALDRGHAEVLAEARAEPARTRAGRILADGRAALARGEAAGAEQALADLEALRADLRREYTLRIVSRPNEATGVYRIPDRNRAARNYYLIVEPSGAGWPNPPAAGGERGGRPHRDRVAVGHSSLRGGVQRRPS